MKGEVESLKKLLGDCMNKIEYLSYFTGDHSIAMHIHWHLFVALICGTHLWHSFVALICSTHFWHSFVALICGTHLWHSFVALICGTHL